MNNKEKLLLVKLAETVVQDSMPTPSGDGEMNMEQPANMFQNNSFNLFPQNKNFGPKILPNAGGVQPNLMLGGDPQNMGAPSTMSMTAPGGGKGTTPNIGV